MLRFAWIIRPQKKPPGLHERAAACAKSHMTFIPPMPSPGGPPVDQPCLIDMHAGLFCGCLQPAFCFALRPRNQQPLELMRHACTYRAMLRRIRRSLKPRQWHSGRSIYSSVANKSKSFGSFCWAALLQRKDRQHTIPWQVPAESDHRMS